MSTYFTPNGKPLGEIPEAGHVELVSDPALSGIYEKLSNAQSYISNQIRFRSECLRTSLFDLVMHAAFAVGAVFFMQFEDIVTDEDAGKTKVSLSFVDIKTGQMIEADYTFWDELGCVRTAEMALQWFFMFNLDDYKEARDEVLKRLEAERDSEIYRPAEEAEKADE